MYSARLARITEAMRLSSISQLLVSAPASVFYLTGKWIHPGERMLALLIRANGDMLLFANRLFALSGATDIPLCEYDDTDDCIKLLSQALQPGKIGIDKTWPSLFTIRLMEARNDLTPVVGSHCVDDARLCKDESELRLMRESSLKNDQTMLEVIRKLQCGMKETDVAACYEQISASLGSSRPSFSPLICFGKNCAEPHHDTDRSVLLRGDSVILDVGLTWKDYCSDMTRTVFMGTPTDEQKRVYDIVCAANEAGRKTVRPGIPLKEVDRAARKVIEDAGYGKYFIHRTGHGIGLEVHEFPDVSMTSEVIAKPGMVFSVEPGIYLPGKFGVRVEDLVAVTPDGCETLNAAPRELIAL
ncbi:MAG: aminopeptidase P family protein [Clostridia bacterium]|nr:aminopeptidase P family protein [Clostridia bacterium]